MCESQETPWSSAKNQVAGFKKLGNIDLHKLGQISQYYFPEAHTGGIDLLRLQRVFDMKNKYEAPKPDLRLWRLIVPLHEWKTRRSSKAKRLLDINGCPKRTKKWWYRLRCDQVAKERKVSKFSDCWWMDESILPMLGLPHDDRRLQHRTLAPEAPVRKHILVCSDDDGRQHGPMRARKDLEPTTKKSNKSSTRTRKTQIFSEERENEPGTIRWSIASRPGRWWQHEHQDSRYHVTEWRDHNQRKELMATDYFKSVK